MESVLVTGGAGFIGSYVAQALLERGKQVVVLDLAELPDQRGDMRFRDQPNLIVVTGSVTDPTFVAETIKKHGVRNIVHCAAIADSEYLSSHPHLAFQINVAGTANVLEAARQIGVARVVLVSSIAAFSKKRYEPIDEEHPVFDIHSGHPSGPYGASKAAAEILALAYHAFIDVVALRPAGVYGYGMKVPTSIRRIVEEVFIGHPVVIDASVDAKRSYTFILDCARAIVSALDVQSTSLRQRVYTLADDRVYSFGQVAEIMVRLVPGAQIKFTEEMTSEKRDRYSNYGKLDTRAAARDLNFAPAYSLEKGLTAYLDTLKKIKNTLPKIG